MGDDVEVNMNWLDSTFPLDKPASDPGVKRGECPGGESSTPTYVRDNFPNGYVSFKNAAIGEIGSVHGIFPPTPTPVAPPTPIGGQCGCGPASGKNQSECNDYNEKKCKKKYRKERQVFMDRLCSAYSVASQATHGTSRRMLLQRLQTLLTKKL